MKPNLIDINDIFCIHEIKTTNRQTLCSSLKANIKKLVHIKFVHVCVFRELAGPSWRGCSTEWCADGLWLAQTLAGVLESTHTNALLSQTLPINRQTLPSDDVN